MPGRLEFHFAIAAVVKNRILQQLLAPIRGAIHEWIIKSPELPGKKENSLKQHRRRLEATRRRDPEQTAQAMETHLLPFQKAVDLMGSLSVRNAAAN